jgi:hypothetical protein
VDPYSRYSRIDAAGARHWGDDTIVFEPKSGGSSTIAAVFDRSYLAVDPETQNPVQSVRPLLIVRDSVLPTNAPPLEGDAFIVSGQRYLVVALEVEGKGTSRVYLRKA